VVKSRDDLQAKTRYLHFLKDTLLFLAEEDEAVDKDTLADLGRGLDQLSFTDIARELDYPRCSPGETDSLRLWPNSICPSTSPQPILILWNALWRLLAATPAPKFASGPVNRWNLSTPATG